MKDIAVSITEGRKEFNRLVQGALNTLFLSYTIYNFMDVPYFTTSSCNLSFASMARVRANKI
jgi:hypothetical protein